MRDWKRFVEEVVRVTRPGGLIVLVEPRLPVMEEGRTEDQTARLFPGFTAFAKIMGRCVVRYVRPLLACADPSPVRSFTARGFDLRCGSDIIPALLRSHDLVSSVETRRSPAPFTPFSDGESADCDARLC